MTFTPSDVPELWWHSESSSLWERAGVVEYFTNDFGETQYAVVPPAGSIRLGDIDTLRQQLRAIVADFDRGCYAVDQMDLVRALVREGSS